MRVATADQQSVNCFVNAVFPNASVNVQTELTSAKSRDTCTLIVQCMYIPEVKGVTKQCQLKSTKHSKVN